jgi:hypothetical protein
VLIIVIIADQSIFYPIIILLNPSTPKTLENSAQIFVFAPQMALVTHQPIKTLSALILSRIVEILAAMSMLPSIETVSRVKPVKLYKKIIYKIFIMRTVLS